MKIAIPISRVGRRSHIRGERGSTARSLGAWIRGIVDGVHFGAGQNAVVKGICPKANQCRVSVEPLIASELESLLEVVDGDVHLGVIQTSTVKGKSIDVGWCCDGVIHVWDGWRSAWCD